MISRPKNLATIKCQFIFNFLDIEEIEIDIEHVNKNKRSKFSAEHLAKIVSFNLDGKVLERIDGKWFGEYHCTYYVNYEETNRKTYKFVFCICSDKPKSIGLITFYQIKRK